MINLVHPFRLVVVLMAVFVSSLAAPSKGASPPFFGGQRSAHVGQTLTSFGVPALHGILDSARNTEIRWPDFTPYKSETAKFYGTNEYALAWTEDRRVRPQGFAVINLLKNADAQGPETEDYDGLRWQERLAKLNQSSSCHSGDNITEIRSIQIIV